MRTLTIESDGESRTRHRVSKTRSFSAVLLGYVQADGLWSHGNSNSAIRPVWMQFAGSEDSIKPFVANIRTGRRATSGNNSRYRDETFELLKSAGYQFMAQKVSAGVMVTAFLPDLFRMDPGMVDPTGIQFVVLPPRVWLAEQALHLDTESVVTHMRKIYQPEQFGFENHRWTREEEKIDPRAEMDKLVTELLPVSTLFAAYLDRRTRCPLVQDVRFQLQLMMATMMCGGAFMASEYLTSAPWGRSSKMKCMTESLGYGEPIGCNIAHSTIETVLAEQVELYFGVAK